MRQRLHESSRISIHVGIDARCLNTDHLRGMGKYVSAMLSHARDANDLRWTLFGDRPEAPFHKPPDLEARKDLFNFRGYRFHTWEQVGLPLRARRANVDILHCTGTTLPLWQPMRTLVTLHDGLLWQSPGGERLNAGWYLERLIPAAFHRAWGIITISEQSRRDILGMWPSLEPKLHLIPHGIADSYLHAGHASPPEGVLAALEGSGYLLYVGGGLKRKRFDWALRVFQRLDHPGVRLCVCGFSHEGSLTAQAGLESHLRGRVLFLPFVAESEMPGLYRNAIAVLYPTLYEGFGFPVVEAQAVGTPVLFSAVGSLQELSGPGAEILPTEDIEAWVTTARRLVSERGGSLSVNEHARSWARRFSWSESARRHVELYRKAASG